MISLALRLSGGIDSASTSGYGPCSKIQYMNQ
jgi:hypothetical protein